MAKEYKVRVYVPNSEIGTLVADAIETKVLKTINSYDGVNGMMSIHDGFISSKGLKLFIALGIKYFPLDNYGDFIITCPNCGERIDDDMILLTYDENLLSGFNINCHRDDCGCQMANVEFIKQ